MSLDAKRRELLQKIRERATEKKGSHRDPHEWRLPQVKSGEEFKAKFFVLPPLTKGSPCESGEATKGMDELSFFYRTGDHWINKKRLPCPRIYDESECPFCQLGFELMGETDDKKARSELAKTYLASGKFAVNVYFPAIKANPEELRGKVKWVTLPKTIHDIMDKCIWRDDAGEDEDDPQPYGIFYDPENAYQFQLHIEKSGGAYNDYSKSKFLVSSKGPIASSAEEIEEILAARHDLPAKFPARTKENLKELAKLAHEVLNGASDGFDSDETSKEEKPKSMPTPKTKVVVEDDDDKPVVKSPKTKVVVEDDEDEPAMAKAKVKPKAKVSIDDDDPALNDILSEFLTE